MISTLYNGNKISGLHCAWIRIIQTHYNTALSSMINFALKTWPFVLDSNFDNFDLQKSD